MQEETYSLIAYDVATNSKVLDWPAVAPLHRFASSDVIRVGDTKWEVVGVRTENTERQWVIDVRRRP